MIRIQRKIRSRFPVGASPQPLEPLTALVGVYALAGPLSRAGKGAYPPGGTLAPRFDVPPGGYARAGLGGSARTPYRLTTPKATKTRRARSEIRVRIPQTNATLLLRTVFLSSNRHVIRPSARIPLSKEGPDHLEGSRNQVVLPSRGLGRRARQLASEGAGRNVRVGSDEARRAALGP